MAALTPLARARRVPARVLTLAAIERAAAVGDIRVLDINYPFAGDDVTVAQETLQRTALRCAMPCRSSSSR